MKVGIGTDAHAFADDRKLILGGVTIPHTQGLAGHSDADVLIHAIIDALLGAAALGDIGQHFPDSDNAYKGVDSRVLLRAAAQKVRDLGYAVVNIDAVIIAQVPRMAPHIERMRANIASDLQIATGAVNVKATTTEGLGFTGRREGIVAQAICLLDSA